MSASVALAIPLGVALGLGVWTLVALIPRIGAARLSSRVARSVADLSGAARDELARRPAEPATVLLVASTPAVRRLSSMVAVVFGGDDAVERRLRQAGAAGDVAAFRFRQLVAGIGGAAAGLVIAAVFAQVSAASPLVLAAVVAFGAAIGLLAPEQVIRWRAAARRRRIASELPTLLEFLTLSLAAGEGIRDALRRAARTGRGELARELGRTIAEVNAGAPLADALTRCASAIDLPALTRSIDQLVGALDRGAPLVDVLRAQAQESRDEAKRHLLESAGRKEVAMLVPLVFGVLPVTIAFAVFPGLLVLQLGL